MRPSSAVDGDGREQPGIPLAMLTTGLKADGTAKDSGEASSISSSYQTYTVDLSGVTGLTGSNAVAIKVKGTGGSVDARLGDAGDAEIAAADAWSEMIYISPESIVTDYLQLKSAAATVIEYLIYVF